MSGAAQEALRIAHIQLGRGGGTERFFMNMLQGFAETGARQMVALRPSVSYAPAAGKLADVIEGPFLRYTPGGFLARARWQRALRRFQPDAVLGWRAPTARLMPPPGTAMRMVRLGDYPDHARHLAGLDAVICNNPDIARHIRGLGHPGRVEVISNFARPVDVVPLDRALFDTPEDAFLICSAARFTHIKGLDTLVRAAAEVRGAWLWLVGEGAERAALEALVAELGLAERTRFLGWMEEPMSAVAAADAFVMPSRIEPLGNALIEAWHAGTASVTTATAGPNWYGTDGQDCLIVPVEDHAAMAAALRRLQGDAGLRDRLQEGAARTLDTRFSKDAVIEAYRALISEF